MKQYTRLEDIESSQHPLSLGALIEHILSTELTIAKTSILDPDNGAVFLLEESDSDQTMIDQFDRSFPHLQFECAQHIVAADAYVCRLRCNNECVITIVVPDKTWVPEYWMSAIKAVLA